MPSARSSARCLPSMRGTAASTCSFSRLMPRPGVFSGTFAAALRSSSDSPGSPRRSSSLVPSMSRRLMRISAHRVAVITTWMPKPRPRLAIVVTTRLQLLVLLPQRAPAVDDEEHVAERVVGDLAGRAAPAVGGHRVDAELGEAVLPLVDEGRHLGDGPADRLGVAPAGDTRHVRQLDEAAQRPAAEVEAVELHLATGCGSARGSRCSERSSVLLPDCGPPTMTTLPPAPSSSTTNGSRRCSNGRSTMPTGTSRRPTPGHRPPPDRGARSTVSSPSRSVEVRRLGQRRQPHLVGRAAVPLQLVHDDVEHRDRLAGLGRLGLDGVGLRRQLRHRHERRAVRPIWPWHHGLRTAGPPIALRYGPETYAARKRSRVWVSALR